MQINFKELGDITSEPFVDHLLRRVDLLKIVGGFCRWGLRTSIQLDSFE
jgi:hypothetical protein